MLVSEISSVDPQNLYIHEFFQNTPNQICAFYMTFYAFTLSLYNVSFKNLFHSLFDVLEKNS